VPTRLRRLANLTRQVIGFADVWLARKLGTRPSRLPILLLFVTNRCNLHCRMCGYWSHDDPDTGPPELTTDEWKAVIEAGGRLGTTLVSITGGEALVRPDVFELCSFAVERGMAVHLCSNGTIIDATRARAIEDAGVSTVSISIESPEREIHERLRGAGTFDAAIEGIRLLHEHAPSVRVGINYCITGWNYRNLAAMVPFAEALGVDQLKFSPIHTNLQHRHKPMADFGDLIFTEAMLDDLDAETERLKIAVAKSPLQTTSTMFLDGITSLYGSPRRHTCFAGWATCAVSPTGAVTPCCDMDGKLNVRNRPLDQIWRGPGFHALRSCVDTCSRACWDTTNAELSLRLSVRSVLKNLGQTWRDVGFYFGRRSR